MNRTLAIFDFDGTLTVRDSMIDFLKRLKGPERFYLNMIILSPLLILFKIGLIPNWKAKEYLFRFFLGGMDLRRFQHECNLYSLSRIPEILRTEAVDKLKFHQDNGHKIVIISASPENWLSSWCKKMNIALIATRMEVENDRVTGKILGKNCFGPQKVSRLKEEYDLRNFDDIYAYGDSKGDLEILSLATRAFYRKFV